MATTQLVDAQSPRVDDPTDLTREEYRAAFKRTLAEVKRDDVPSLAAGVAFKMFLSLFPALFAAVAIFSLVTTVSELEEWLGQAEGFLPASAIELLKAPLTDLASGEGVGVGFAAVIGVLAGIWAATSAAVSLMKALSRAYDVAEARTFLRQRLVALALTVALLLALVGVIVLLVMGPQIQRFLLGEIVAPITWLLAAARLVLAFAVLVVLFAFVYWVGPDRDHPAWMWLSPGALFGVVSWLLVSLGFTLYAQTTGSYSETYGAIAGVVVMLVWLQLSMLVILIGGEFNAEVERTRSLHQAVRDGAGFSAPAGSGMPVANADTSAATRAETQIAAHTIAPTGSVDQSAVGSAPAVVLASDAGGASRWTSQVRRAGAVAVAVTTAAVLVGLARRRTRR